MSDAKAPRYALLGLFVLLLVGALLLSLQYSPEPASPTPASTSGLRSLAELDSQPPARRALKIERWNTAEGARVLFVAAPQLPMFDLRLTFAAGSSQDGDNPGLALLTNAMLNEGVPGKDVTAIAEGFEDLGAQFGNGAYRDMAVVSLRSLSAVEQREPALALFSAVIGTPSFPEDALLRIRNQLLAGFEQRKRDPARLGNVELFQRLYGTHPYAHPSEGDPASLQRIDSAQLRAFHARAYSAGNAVVALVGDLSRAEAEAIAAQVSAALPPGPALPPVPAPEVPSAQAQHIEFPSQQTHLLLAQLGIDRRDPDYPALYLGNQILGGGGFGSRLMEEVREKRGLSYGVYSGFSPMQTRGPFMISLQTRADQSEATLELVRGLLREFIAEGPTDAELQRAKRELAGSFPLSTASNADIVSQLGAMGFYDLPLTWLEDFVDDVQALDAEQVRQALQRQLNVEQLVVVSVGPTVAQQPLPPATDASPAASMEPRH
jgi:zinc protease